jgi:hypothetical protein
MQLHNCCFLRNLSKLRAVSTGFVFSVCVWTLSGSMNPILYAAVVVLSRIFILHNRIQKDIMNGKNWTTYRQWIEQRTDNSDSWEICQGCLASLTETILKTQYGSRLHGSNTPLGLLPWALFAHGLRQAATSHANSAYVLAVDATSRRWPMAAHGHIFMLQ